MKLMIYKWLWRKCTNETAYATLINIQAKMGGALK